MLVVHTTKGSPVIVLGRATWRLYSDSPRDGAIIFGDLDGKLQTLRVERSTCTRAGQYWIARLIEQRRRDGKVADLLAEVSADCPRRVAGPMNDQCGVRCPDLARVL
jgi:hypothetical protein